MILKFKTELILNKNIIITYNIKRFFINGPINIGSFFINIIIL